MATPAARPVPGAAPAQQRSGPMRCFKCGGRHLARDCTAPPAEVDAFKAAARDAEAAAKAAPPPPPPGAVKRKRKLTLDDLKV
jgi:hypothetical protein